MSAKNPTTHRGFTVPVADLDEAKRAAHAAGQSLNVWVSRAIRSALDAPPPAAPVPPVADLSGDVAELRALHQEWRRQMSSVGTRLALLPPAPPPSSATPPPVDESGLTPLAL